MSTTSRLLQRSVFLNGLFVIEGGAMFLLDIALAASLGLGVRSDTLYAAWSLPLTIGRGAFQSLTNSLIGLFAEAENDTVAYSQAQTVIGVISFAIGLLMALTSRFWFPLSVPGAAAETRAAGAPLAAILSWLIALLALAETQRAIYYRLGVNYFPSAARVLGALASIALILLASPSQNLTLAAYGLVIGAAVEMLLSLTGLLWMGHRFRFAWPPRDKLRRMARVVGLPIVGQGILIGANTAERALASFLGPGTVTAVIYANRIIQMLERFVFRGFVIATIQAFTTGMKQHWKRDTRLLVLISVPIMVVFAVLPTAIITILFERGRFTAESTQQVSFALRAFALAIPIVALNRVPYALAFAQNKSRELLTFYTIYAVTLVGAEIVLISLGVDLATFGIAYVLAVSAGTIYLYSRVMGAFDGERWSADEVLRLFGVGLVVFAGTALVAYAVPQLVTDPALSSWLTLLLGGGSAMALLAVAVWLFRLPESAQIANLLRRAGR
jgi:putative peptidoglycan lipid II flippase